jgi:hypothetical protein
MQGQNELKRRTGPVPSKTPFATLSPCFSQIVFATPQRGFDLPLIFNSYLQVIEPLLLLSAQ